VITDIQNIQMVDLRTQYHRIKSEIDEAVLSCIESTEYINGSAVKQFQSSFEQYLNVKHVIPCANGTDALQIAMMALGLKQGDEVIVPSFTYVATAEVIALLNLTPVMVDCDKNTFNITVEDIEKAITQKTKAIVPVHLFGQGCDMESIMALATKYNLYVIEDNAQAIGANYTFSDGSAQKTGTIGHIGCTSFFPSKNLGCYGDGGAIMTNDDDLAQKLRMVANHGQKRRYYHDVIGVNSRLDSVQAAILDVKLKHLDAYNAARNKVANYYDNAFKNIEALQTPLRQYNSTHVFHQYTLQVKNEQREALQAHLMGKKIPSMIYYPVPLYKQNAFKHYQPDNFALPITEELCRSVMSLPIHTEMDESLLAYITEGVTSFFR
jgi:UDP-2-acetamido-2-deoxy-ribo-hexuluronate aminotransferase